ncbi:MAG: GNAT family N-acetyltransferase [Clostridiales bacterium]|nr:GNAT family N-acetyltransferase [Clostridiales bacterium]
MKETITTDKKIQIRPYEEKDFERLAEIHDPARKNELASAGLQDAFVPFSIAAKTEGLFEYEVYVAEYEGETAGFIAFEEEEIVWLYVDVNYARRGIGKSLIHFALERVRKEDVSIEVLEGNDPAIRLYKSCGFRITETLSGQMPGNEKFSVTAHVMRYSC